MHRNLGPHVRLHDDMNMVRPHVRRPQRPTAMQTNLSQRAQHNHSSVSIEKILRLIHLSALHRDTLCISPRESASKHIMVPVNRAGFVAMQMRPIAGEGNQVPKKPQRADSTEP